MTADQQFRHWMRTLIVLFIVLFLYIVIADRHAPLTTEGRVQGYVVQLAPEVSGKVTDVLISNNQEVRKGEVLFKIDDRKYRIALEQAKLSLQAAYEKEATLYSQREAAIANIARAQATFDNAHREYVRLQKLSSKKVISQSALDDAFAQNQVSNAALKAEKQNLKVIEAQLGDQKGQSSAVRIAQNGIDKAMLDLANTEILAPSDGVVTNLQLEAGTMANSNLPLLTFVPTGSMWVAADFREKSVAGVDKTYHALVTFDANPGVVYDFDLSSRDYGVAAAQQTPNGALTKVEVNNRWVRDAQRTRVNLTSDEALPNALFVGSRATIVLYPDNSVFWQMMANAQIYLASWFHFIY
ncbi:MULTISPECIES: HlyD family secretion protein [Vibrio]|uniref:Multidrug transporter n=1 Tax=Vibrio natriegens NBRC 15636 = ATCC 14048 = DSM 759 TaxID=1219067 RepID=A0AAN0Y375_VIBNA|nr:MULTISPECIES: HlyD family secretion protein [Vibrio]AEX22558.1 secretion protein [Vibrio sp. EJY3]ALR15145.1 multidrug transporter [Vibrio natriegens NBRC 15636 = ATCC 14048 = DSM 759]ANQ12989.1 multidrug transporter [Vibrio natriegens NBRC 15636 = ATCC 14048 = DSM 759]EPM39428.1 multidrug transporter [Vibrio natriegens NBRC 15636 = ATCC 14048 = DSM 759]MDX6027408.1 HlyD family secretion protein [Vibrio natriegens NBRC 15636 = ATCC 14048 = DSM 759]